MKKDQAPIDPEEFEKLKGEICRLQAEIDANKKSAERTQKAGWGFSRLLAKLFFGGSVTRNFNAASDAWLKWSRTRTKNDFARAYVPSRNFFGAVASRFTRAGILGLVIGTMPIFLLWRQTALFTEQNKKFDVQNKEFQIQNKALIEQAQLGIQFETRRELQLELGSIIRELSGLERPIYVDKTNIQKPPKLTSLITARIKNLGKDAIWWDEHKELSRKSKIRSNLLIALAHLNIKLNGFNFEKSDLRSVDLRDLSLKHANLIGSDLSSTLFDRSFLNWAKLYEANLSHASMAVAKLNNADLHNSNLAYVDLHNADIRNTNFASSSLMEANLEEVEGDAPSFNSAFLCNAWFEHADLPNGNFVRAFLDDSVFVDATLSDSYFYSAELHRADFRNANLIKAGFSNADLTEADFENADLTGADFVFSRLQKTTFYKANLAKADFRDAKDWRQIATVKNANIWGIKNASEFKKWAVENGAVEMVPDEYQKYLNSLEVE